MSWYGKWPRHYADEIIRNPDLETRRALLARVPPHWQGYVKHLVMDYIEKARFGIAPPQPWMLKK